MIRPMCAFEPPDTHFLSAAVGWLELGNLDEARSELARLSPDGRNHPDVLEVRWLIHAEEKNWDAALTVARALVVAAPKRSSGWLHRAYALRRVSDGGLHAAWEALHPAYEDFPKEPTIPYNLACYACQMKRLEEARVWLERAIRIGGKDRIRMMALNDADLEPLWEEIKKF